MIKWIVKIGLILGLVFFMFEIQNATINDVYTFAGMFFAIGSIKYFLDVLDIILYDDIPFQEIILLDEDKKDE